MTALPVLLLALAVPAHAGKPGMSTARTIGVAWACGAINSSTRNRLLAALLDQYPADAAAIMSATHAAQNGASPSACGALAQADPMPALLARLLPPRG